MRARWLALIALAATVGALAGCWQAIAAVAAPEAAAAGATADAVGGAISDSFNQAAAGDLASTTTTATDIDRILGTMPDDSPQRADLMALRDQVGEGSLAGAAPMQARHFVSDPQRDQEYDHRKEADTDAGERRRATHGFMVVDQPGSGHRLVLEEPRRIGADQPSPRDEPKPFAPARESDLTTWEPRWYSTAMPAQPGPHGVDRHDID